MEKIFKEIGKQSLGLVFFQDITTSFRSTSISFVSFKAPQSSLNPKGLLFFSAWVQTVDKIVMINILFNTCSMGFKFTASNSDCI